MRYLILGFLVFAGVSRCARGDLIYTMDFTTDALGVTHSGSGNFASGSYEGPNWILTWPNVATDTTQNSFQTSGGNMVVADWGGLGTITSSAIN